MRRRGRTRAPALHARRGRWLACLLAGALAALPGAPAEAGGTAAGRLLQVGHSATFAVRARLVTAPLDHPEGPAPTLARGGARSAPAGEGRARRAAPAGPGGRATGEGLVWLTLQGLGTSWASTTATAAVVTVSVDGGTAQTVVLFDGSRPFTYEGFLGPLAEGVHRVRVTVSRRLSHAGASPGVLVRAVRLRVVPPDSPDYLAEAYAPVLYGRSSSATRYTPLLTDVAVARAPRGAHTVSYVLLVSAHDQGDSLVPAYQWGLWGRMTDIVSMLTETVAADGSVTSATYASCGCEGLAYPDWVMSARETTAPFRGRWYGHHPVLRDATATNYLSDQGRTQLRFQQAPVAAPGPGRLRTAVMDAHPWTYEISNEELPREHVISTDPDTLLVGDYRQYAVVAATLRLRHARSAQVELRLAGDATWYSTDYRQATGGAGATFPFITGGQVRSVVKLPLDWGARRITGLRIRLDASPGAPPPQVQVGSLRVLEVTASWTVVGRALPPPQVVADTSLVPVSPPGGR